MIGMEARDQLIDAYCNFLGENGGNPRILKLGQLYARDLAKLGRDQLGSLAERLMTEGLEVLEQTGLMGCKVQLVPGSDDFQFE